MLLDHELLSEHLDAKGGELSSFWHLTTPGDVEVVYRPGLRVATASGDEVRVWELPTGEHCGLLSGHHGPVRRSDRCPMSNLAAGGHETLFIHLDMYMMDVVESRHLVGDHSASKAAAQGHNACVLL